MKQCVRCLNENVSTIVENNHIFYYCANCKEKSTRVIDNDGINFSTKENGLIKHITVGTLIEKKDELLLMKRQKFPYGFGIPTTHLHNEETVEEALIRLFTEKIGLNLNNKKLIFHQTLIDPCRYGAELHECYIFRCKVSDFNAIGPERTNLYWKKKNLLKDTDLISNAKIIFSRINFLEKDENLVVHADINRTPRVSESSIIDSLPLSIITFDKKSKPSFTNNAAEKLLQTLNKQNKSDYTKFIKALTDISNRSILTETNTSNIIKNSSGLYNIVANPLISNGRICGSTIVIKDVTEEKRHEAHDVLAYQTSMTLSSKSSHTSIIKTMMKQMFSSMDIDGASLMILEHKILKVIVNYSIDDVPKHKPLILRIGEGVAGYVAKNQTILAVPNTDNDSLFADPKNHKSKSLLSIPVVASNKLWGVLNLTKPKNSFFSEGETKMASIVANRIAQAMENEELYQTLNNKKKTLETVLRTTTDGLIMIDKDHNLMFANETAIKLLPIKKSDLENKVINQYLSELSSYNSNKIKSLIQKSINEKKSLTTEFVSQKGKEKILKVRFTPIIEKNRRCDSVVIGLNDITKLEKRQKTVKAQVKQLTELFKISSLSITSSSKFFENVLKKSAVILDSELADVYFFDPKNDKTGLVKNPSSEIPNLLSQIIEKGNLNQEFICNKTKSHFDNVKNISRIIITPVRIENKIVGVLYAINKKRNYNSKDAKWLSIIATRLASRIETTQLFEQVEKDGQSLKKIIEHSGEGIIVINSRGKTIVWNKAIENITGFESTKELLKHNPEVLLRYRDLVHRAKDKDDETISQEIKIINYDHQEQWLSITMSFIRSGNRIEFIIAVIRDISQEKTIENRNKEFIYTTTHELRTPITAIKGYLSMILNGDAGAINSKQKMYFDRVYQSTDKLVLLVEDLLKTARIEENKVVFNKTPFNSKRLISDVMIDFEQKAKNKNISLKLSESPRDIRLIGDYDKTKQALSNLVDNAIKYTVRGDIVIKTQKIKTMGTITVEDTGIGVPKKDLASIFNKFYRVPNSESVKAGGTGLGLFIVKNLIEKQGGKIEIASKLGKGTSISILLPLNNRK